MTFKLLSTLAPIALCAIGSALPAAAAGGSTPPVIVPVTATSQPDCKINTVTGGFNFGMIDAITNTPGTPHPQVSIAFQCNKGTQFGILAGAVSGTPVSLANGGSYSTSSGFGGTGYTISAVSGATGTATASAGALTTVLQGSLNSSDVSVGTFSDSVAITIAYQ